MTRHAFLKKYLLKFAIALALLGLIVYTVGHAMGMSADHLLTTPVRRVTDRTVTSAMAYLFRDETLLSTPGAGLIDELSESGTKVSKNLTVASFYSSVLSPELLESAQLRLNAINRAIRILEKSAPTASDSLADAEGYRTDAVSTYADILADAHTGNLDGVLAREDAFLSDLNRYLSLTDRGEEHAALLEQLKQQKTELLQGTPTQIRNTQSSGVYYGNAYVDGYEEIFKTDVLKDLTADRFSAIREKLPADCSGGRYAGKMVYGYAWYAVMELPEDVIPSFAVGSTYSVTFPENRDRTLTLTLERTDGNMAIFRSDDSPADFIYYRTQPAEITVHSREGFYIPETALHTVDGTVGVYVFENSTAYFRRIEVLYLGDGYCIAALPGEGNQTEIGQNDVLITGGRDLYDGRMYH